MDQYKNRLKKAGWTWLEGNGNPRNKDRVEGRHAKRGAKNEMRREINNERKEIE